MAWWWLELIGRRRKSSCFGGLLRRQKRAEKRLRRGRRSVGDGDLAASRVIHGKNGQILHQRPAAPDVQNLDTEANRKERLVEIVGILKKKLIDIFASAVRRCALGHGILPVLVRVDVRGAAGKKNALAGINQVGDLNGRRVERNLDRLAATAFDSNRVLRPRALIVVDVGAGGLRNRDARAGMTRGVHQVQV